MWLRGVDVAFAAITSIYQLRLALISHCSSAFSNSGHLLYRSLTNFYVDFNLTCFNKVDQVIVRASVYSFGNILCQIILVISPFGKLYSFNFVATEVLLISYSSLNSSVKFYRKMFFTRNVKVSRKHRLIECYILVKCIDIDLI